MVDGTKYRGRLEVYYLGQWGMVCKGGFGDREGIVACKQMGYGYYTLFDGAEGTWPDYALMYNVDCDGDEYRLHDCSRDITTYETYYDSCGVNDVVGLECIQGMFFCVVSSIQHDNTINIYIYIISHQLQLQFASSQQSIHQ